MPSDYLVVTDAERENARRKAEIMAANIIRRGCAGDRSRVTVESDCNRGLIVEQLRNRGDEAWWNDHWEKAQVVGDDGGIDTRDGTDLKVIRPGNRFVFVKRRSARAENYEAWELDDECIFARRMGTFTRGDIRDNIWGGVSGVLVSDLK